MEVIKTDCGLCINCCGVDAHVEDGKLVKVEGTSGHWLNDGALCPKGQALVDWVYSPARLKYPMKKVNGKFERISWDQALDEIGSKLLELREKYGPTTLATWTGGVGVEHFEMAAFNQRLAKTYGSPNFFNPEGICFRTRILARQITYGRYPVEEPKNSNCIILWGHNPEESYWPNAKIIRQRLKENDLKLIVIDVKRIPLAKEGIFLQPRPGTDAAIALAMMNVIIEEDLWDKEFVENYTSGFDKLCEHVKEYTPEKAEVISGVPASEIRRISRIFANTEGACIMEGVGHMNQYANGLQTERAFAILMAITGNVDRPGGWVTCPQIRLADLRVPIEEQNLGYDEYPVFHHFGKRTPPYGSASMLTESIVSGKPNPIKAFISSGSNPAITFPDTKLFMEALKNLELFVSIDPFMTETSQLADYALPASTFLEETGIGGFPYAISFCEPYIMLRKQVIPPQYESMPIWEIWSKLGCKMGYEENFPWKTDEEVARHFFSAASVSYDDLMEHPEGLFFGEKTYELFKDIGFSTDSKKIELYSPRMAELGAAPIPEHVEPHQSAVSDPELVKKYPEVLLTGARKIENQGAQMHDIGSLRARVPEAYAEMSNVTAAKYGVVDGEMIGLESTRGMITVRAKVNEDIREGIVSIPYGWPASNSNVLLDASLRDEVSGYITLRGLACRVVKLD